MKIAVLALQGAFAEHIRVMQELNVETVEIRQLRDLENNPDIAGIILPGGESTVQGKLLNELGLMEPLREKIRSGLPVLGTCAGLILLASGIANDSNRYFATLPVTVTRNAYGRQSGSFNARDDFGDFGKISMTFIRAPIISSVDNPEVKILSSTDGAITGVRYRNQLGITFHPELDNDYVVHKYFKEIAAGYAGTNGN